MNFAKIAESNCGLLRLANARTRNDEVWRLVLIYGLLYQCYALPRNDGEQHRFCDLIAESRPFMPKIC
ncbi:hypothetical protein ACWIUD_06750 [Helicobacter sp. 23-1044]